MSKTKLDSLSECNEDPAKRLKPDNLAMFEPSSLIVDQYSEIVTQLRICLNRRLSTEAFDANNRLSVVIFGHGGRDTCLSFAVIQAVAFDEKLRDVVDVHVCTCSWDDDDWEPRIIEYVDGLKTLKIIPETINWEAFEFRNGYKTMLTETNLLQDLSHGALRNKLRQQMEGKHMIIECEQGLDVFVPLWADKMQDNYEDWIVHAEALLYAAESPGVEVMLLQSNPELDLARGINGEEVNANIFGGKLQIDAFTQKLSWKTDVPASLLDRDPRAGGVPRQPETVIQLAILCGALNNPKLGLEECFGISIDKNDPYSMQKASGAVNPATDTKDLFVGNLYVGSTLHLVVNNICPIPVVGMLECMANMSWLGASNAVVDANGSVPKPSWLLGYSWRPGHWQPSQPRIVDEWRVAFHDLELTASRTDWFWALMKYRNGRRQPMGGVFQVHPRCQGGFECQLALAETIARRVRDRCPNFNLWARPQLLRNALSKMSDHTNKSIFHNMRIMIVDFVCVLLEHPSVDDGMRHVKQVVLPHLEFSEKPLATFKPAEQQKVEAEWAFLAEELLGGWEAQELADQQAHQQPATSLDVSQLQQSPTTLPCMPCFEFLQGSSKIALKS